MIRSRLAATTVRLTNIIEISYRSKAPRSAVAVVNAVLQSYLEFMDKTHRGTAGELLNVFNKEKVQIEERLAKTQIEVLAARRKFGDLGIHSESNVVHPMVQRVLDINQGLIKAQQERLETQATLAAIEAGDPRRRKPRPTLAVDRSIDGPRTAAGRPRIQPARYREPKAKLDQQLLDDRTELRKTARSITDRIIRNILAVSERIRHDRSLSGQLSTEGQPAAQRNPPAAARTDAGANGPAAARRSTLPRGGACGQISSKPGRKPWP